MYKLYNIKDGKTRGEIIDLLCKMLEGDLEKKSLNTIGPTVGQATSMEGIAKRISGIKINNGGSFTFLFTALSGP